jgi:transposase
MLGGASMHGTTIFTGFGDRVVRAVEGGLSRRRVPPHSPDLNSISRRSLKLKAHMRKAQERSIDTLWQRIGKLIDLFHPLERANFFSSRPTSTSAAGKPSLP